METPYQQLPQETAKSSKVFTASLTIIVLLVAGYALAAKLGDFWPFGEGSDATICTLDAKLCPDGSYVSRTGPRCEFETCSSGVLNSVVGWETYTNVENGYEFKYPNDWRVADSLLTGPPLHVASIFQPPDAAGDGPANVMVILVFPNSERLTPLQWAQKNLEYSNFEDGINSDYQEQKFLGKPSISYIREGLWVYDIKVVSSENFIFLISIHHPDRNIANDPVYKNFYNILSTFKFTSADVAWKTYTNRDGVMFTIQYPQEWTEKNMTGNFGENIFTLDSGAAGVGGIQIMWGSQNIPNTSPCPTGTKPAPVQIKGRSVTMCYSSGSSQEPPSYQYSSTQNGIKYVVSSSYYPGEQNKAVILQIFSSLDIAQ